LTAPLPAVPSSDAELEERARALTWLLFDVDGVLTDGRLFYGEQGERLKVFDVRDGLAIKLARQAGLKVGLLSGRGNGALKRRMAEITVDLVVLSVSDKRAAFADILAEQGITAAQVAYTGDDLPDLPVLTACGLSFAPADAAADVRARVHRVLASPGGRGAAREVVEAVLKARGAWDALVGLYL
jgi:3-deoxy-D-manno-octulosonate 8-phosphate phosphatase (KDO 8-P phosphatase)